MTKLDNLKLFIISRIFGLIFLIISIFLLVSLIGFNENALAFKYVNSSSTTLNYLLITLKDFGAAKISRSLLILLDYSSYLIPIFFLIIGIKLNFGIKYNYLNLFIRFFSLYS